MSDLSSQKRPQTPAVHCDDKTIVVVTVYPQSRLTLDSSGSAELHVSLRSIGKRAFSQHGSHSAIVKTGLTLIEKKKKPCAMYHKAGKFALVAGVEGVASGGG
jgi:hypothetical protein